MATTYTLPDGTLLTKPAYSDAADIEVINTSMQNLANNITTISTDFNTFKYKTIAENSNMNSFTTAGFYACLTSAIAQTLSNCPVTGNFTLMVQKKGNYCSQLINYGNKLFIRELGSSAWTNWVQFVPNPPNDLGTFATQSALDNALDAIVASTSAKDSQKVWMYVSTAFGVFGSAGYSGTLYKPYDGRARVIFYQNASSIVFQGTKSSTGWQWMMIPTIFSTSVQTGASKKYTFTPYARYQIIFHGYTVDTRGMIYGVCDSASCNMYNIVGTMPSAITITTSGLSMTIANSGTYATPITISLFSGGFVTV